MFLDGAEGAVCRFVPASGERRNVGRAPREGEPAEEGSWRLDSVVVVEDEEGVPSIVLMLHSGSRCLFLGPFPSVDSDGDSRGTVAPVRCQAVCPDHSGPISCITFVKTSEGPSLVVTGCEDGSLYSWAVIPAPTEGTQEKKILLRPTSSIFKGHQSGISAIEGLYNAVATGGHDQCVKLWSVPSWQCVHKLDMEASVVSALSSARLNLVNADSFEGKVGGDFVSIEGLIAGSGEGMAFVWSLTNMELLGVIAGPESRIVSVCASPDGKALMFGFLDGSVAIYRVEAPNFPEAGRHKVRGAAIDSVWFCKEKHSITNSNREKMQGSRSILAVWSDEGIRRFGVKIQQNLFCV